ncbi:hypothetical protein D3C81_1928090 [compost metagenome]
MMLPRAGPPGDQLITHLPWPGQVGHRRGGNAELTLLAILFGNGHIQRAANSAVQALNAERARRDGTVIHFASLLGHRNSRIAIGHPDDFRGVVS